MSRHLYVKVPEGGWASGCKFRRGVYLNVDGTLTTTDKPNLYAAYSPYGERSEGYVSIELTKDPNEPATRKEMARAAEKAVSRYYSPTIFTYIYVPEIIKIVSLYVCSENEDVNRYLKTIGLVQE